MLRGSTLIILCVIIVIGLSGCGGILYAEELRWDWSTLNITEVLFPRQFLWGCSDSALQTEGIITSNGRTIQNSWTEYELRNVDLIAPEARVGVACERWTRYKSDIQLLKNIGMNSYRFSVEWSKIEPQEGIFDHKAMQHYCDVIDELLRHKIVPIVTLFHHTYPLWFLKKKGFEKRENINFFVRFSQYVFTHLHTKVPFWIILNEPVGYALEGYYRGNYPPGKTSLRLAGKVARNQLNAHVTISKIFRGINSKVKIGIAHIIQPLDAYHPWNPLEGVIAHTFDYIVNGLTIDFFKTGRFNWMYLVRDYNEDASTALDFIGINYYSHTTIKQTNVLSLKTEPRESETLIDQPGPGKSAKVMYPEGLYRAIKMAAVLNIPMYITENGCSTENANIKDEYIKKHLYVISRALQEGYNIQGYFFWTLMDCFCWRKGYRDKHGIYAVDFVTQERTLRTNCNYLLDTIKKFNG